MRFDESALRDRQLDIVLAGSGDRTGRVAHPCDDAAGRADGDLVAIADPDALAAGARHIDQAIDLVDVAAATAIEGEILGRAGGDDLAAGIQGDRAVGEAGQVGAEIGVADATLALDDAVYRHRRAVADDDRIGRRRRLP
jgi:hypothetical protein